MKNRFLIINSWPLALLLTIAACTKRGPELSILNQGEFRDTSMALKDAADFPIGAAVNYNSLAGNTLYKTVALRDFNSFTLENEMKHGSVVQSNGTLNFTNADAAIAALGQGARIFGHVLGWHSQQNASYIKEYAGITLPAPAELATGGDFENGSNNGSWGAWNGGASVTFLTDGAESHTGNGYMKVISAGGNYWDRQVASPVITTTTGKEYLVSFWIKAATAGGVVRLSTNSANGAQYQGDQTIGTAWQKVSWSITANGAEMRIMFDMGKTANTYYVDDVSVTESIVAPGGAAIAAKVDELLSTYISGMVTHFKGKVYAWDVINEILTDGGQIRNNSNTDASASGIFVWSEYLGKDFALKAFNYAKTADPTADLYINDYNLESSTAKTDSLVSLINYLKSNGAKVDGIGTQMHISRTTSKGGIDRMFQKLAATGLKVRISELDILSVGNSAAGGRTDLLDTYQAEMYYYVVRSYIKNIPATQRSGITVWGIQDAGSWRYNNGKEFPLLYDNSFARKQAYAAVLKALKE